MSKEEILNLLKKTKMMQFGILDSNGPWVVTLFYALDDELNMYWISLPDTRHSEAIGKNSKASVAVPVEFKFGEPIQGLSMSGEAEHLSDPGQIRNILELYAEQMNREESFVEDMINGTNPHELYVFRPDYAKVFDRVNNQPGSEISTWNK